MWNSFPGFQNRLNSISSTIKTARVRKYLNRGVLLSGLRNEFYSQYIAGLMDIVIAGIGETRRVYTMITSMVNVKIFYCLLH
jgi:hypothetical protein